ncbi:hypothetical protein niasHT_019689 [Heterodera trifolii]|uniref:C2H2-type domain-containing protein n=1 Tax=Heterodera trifolii TaxID=157864 RepID=A0ABD2LBW2_9BILA
MACSCPAALPCFVCHSPVCFFLAQMSGHDLYFGQQWNVSFIFIAYSALHCSTTTSTQQQISVAVEATAAETTAKMPYRTDLKRPDLKGQFPCNVCGKVFCHSSSLSRHRMQAHFKSYTCTQCNQEIASSDTLRSHMYRYHQIQRMFMCRCCNWAFPDKTSLHIHMQSMQKSGMPGDVSVLARSFIDKEEMISPGHHQDHFSHPSFGSPSYNSSPDEEEQNQRQEQSSSPSLSEIEEKDDAFLKIDVETEKEGSPSQMRSAGGGIFPQHSADFHRYNVNDHRATVNMKTNAEMGGDGEKCGCIGEMPPTSCSENAIPTSAHAPPISIPLSVPPFPSNPSQQPQHTVSTTIFQQQWFTQWLANNPFFASALDGYLNNNNNNISAIGGSGGIKGLLTHTQQQQHSNVASHNHSSSQMAMLQALIAAATSSTSAASPSFGNYSSVVNAPTPLSNGGFKLDPQQQHQPPPKKAKTATGGGKGKASANVAAADASHHRRQQQKDTKSDGGIGATTDNDLLSVHIPHDHFHSPFSSNGSANSPTSNDGSKMCALIDSLLHIKRSSGQNSPIDEQIKTKGGRTIREETERRNKRKTRVPTRATEMAEIVYGDEPETYFEKSEKSELAQAASPNIFPSIQRLMLAHSSAENCASSLHFPSSSSADPQQLSPAVSDSQTSGSSNGMTTTTTEATRGMNSPPAATNSTKCHPTGESDQDTPTSKGIGEFSGKKSQGKVEKIRQIVTRITTAAEEVAEEKVREELIDCARQLQLVTSSAEEKDEEA